MYCLISLSHHLDRELGDDGVRTGGPTVWPPRSLDINSLDFLLTDNIKDEINAARIAYLYLLKSRMRETTLWIDTCALTTVQKNERMGLNLIIW